MTPDHGTLARERARDAEKHRGALLDVPAAGPVVGAVAGTVAARKGHPGTITEGEAWTPH